MLVLIITFAASLALIIANGILVAAELAIVRVRRTRLEELAGQGRPEAVHAIELVDRMSEYLTTTQVGVTAVSLGVGWLGEGAFARLFDRALPTYSGAVLRGAATVLSFGLVTMLHVVLGELVPKNLAIANGDRYLMAIARTLRTFHHFVRPISRSFTTLAASIQRALGQESVAPRALSEDELKLVLTDSHEEGVLTAHEAKIVLRAFEFADKSAREIMVPAERVAYLSLARSFEQNFAIALEHMHARLPLCETDLDSVIGIVGLKDALLLRTEDTNLAFERVSRPLTKLRPDVSQEEILRRFQAGGVKMGVVRDVSDRHTLGIVTVEDVLESLVGDVREARLPRTTSPSPSMQPSSRPAKQPWTRILAPHAIGTGTSNGRKRRRLRDRLANRPSR